LPEPDNREAASVHEPAIRVVMLPRDTNKHGTIFGGIILSYIDMAGGVEAGRHTTSKIVTVGMKEVVFHEPVFVGEVVSFYASTIRIGRTSITVHVDVQAERAGRRIPVTAAELTFVAVDKDGRPTPVRPPQP